MSFAPTPHVGLPDPIAVSDFKTGVYSIGGVAKTYDDLWANQAEMLTDAGLQFDFAWESGTPTSASAIVTGSTDLFNAVVGAEINFTAVIDVTIATESPAHGLNIDLWLYNSLFAGFSYDAGGSGLQDSFDTVVNAGFDAYPNAVPVAGFNRMAFTLETDRIITSCNGAPAATRLVSVPVATELRLYFLATQEYDQPIDATITCERAIFYPPQTSAALPFFSARPAPE